MTERPAPSGWGTAPGLTHHKGYKLLAMLMRIVLVAGLSLSCATAQAELTCEQMGAIAQTTVDLRNQGNTLNALLAEARRDGKAKYTEQELVLIGNLIRHSYDSIGVKPVRRRRRVFLEAVQAGTETRLIEPPRHSVQINTSLDFPSCPWFGFRSFPWFV